MAVTGVVPIRTNGIKTPDDEKLDTHEVGMIRSKFSDALRSRTIRIVTRRGPEFYVHEELLCRESEKFNRQLRGRFKEAQTGEILDCDECPELLSMFFEYLYRESSLHDEKICHTYEIRVLARLYCLAERLCAKSFQDAVFWKFSQLFYGKYSVQHFEVFQTLLTLHAELPERKGGDFPMRQILLWWAASRLGHLKKLPEFGDMLQNHYPSLGCQLLMLAGDGPSSPKPSFSSVKPKPHFEKDIKFIKDAAEDHQPEL
ncbi:hypothetical protein HDK90DRAFT_544772 [Phyllosticta capitalensis]|uniref:BTB domain-containing protein n=1 Tax=Phyllosticta capitalensis TaxID=121624 RepID=A0ABR1Y9R1_9PEZI